MVVADVTEAYLHLTEILLEVDVVVDELEIDLDDHRDVHNYINDEVEVVKVDDEEVELDEIDEIRFQALDEVVDYELHLQYHELNNALHDDDEVDDAEDDDVDVIDDETEVNIIALPVQQLLVEVDDDE